MKPNSDAVENKMSLVVVGSPKRFISVDVVFDSWSILQDIYVSVWSFSLKYEV